MRHHYDMRGALHDLDAPGPGALCHESHCRRRNGEICAAVDRPVRQRLPRRLTRGLVPGGLRERSLGRCSELRLCARQVCCERTAELRLFDVQILAAAFERYGRGECGAELCAWKPGGHAEGALTGFEREPGDVDQGPDVAVPYGLIADHRAAVRVTDEDHGPGKCFQQGGNV